MHRVTLGLFFVLQAGGVLPFPDDFYCLIYFVACHVSPSKKAPPTHGANNAYNYEQRSWPPQVNGLGAVYDHRQRRMEAAGFEPARHGLSKGPRLVVVRD